MRKGGPSCMYSPVRIQLSDHFTYRKLIRFTLPSVCMMVFTSIYSVVDGFFVSNYAGKNSLVAVNLIMPLFIILGTIGFMLGTGGNAIVARTLGEGDRERAKRYFSFLVYACIGFGLLIVLLGQLFIRRVAVFFGAGGGHPGSFAGVRKNPFGGHAVLHAAEPLPELLRHG